MLVRQDLSPPQQAVQALHAVIELSRLGKLPRDGNHPHLVLLGVLSEDALLSFADQLHYADIPYAVWTEPDRNDEATALAVPPGASRKLFRKLPLLDLQLKECVL